MLVTLLWFARNEFYDIYKESEQILLTTNPSLSSLTDMTVLIHVP